MPNPRWYELGGRLADQREAQAARDERENARQEAMQFAKDKFSFEREQTLAGNKRADLMLAIQGVQGAYPEAAAGLAMHPESRKAILADPAAGRREQFARKTQSGVESTLRMLGVEPQTSLAAPRGSAPAQLADILSGQTARQEEYMAADLGQFTKKSQVGQGFSRQQREASEDFTWERDVARRQFMERENMKNRWLQKKIAQERKAGGGRSETARLREVLFKALIKSEFDEGKLSQMSEMFLFMDPERGKLAVAELNKVKGVKSYEDRIRIGQRALQAFAGGTVTDPGPAEEPAEEPVSPEAAKKAAAAVKKFREGRGQ